MQGQSADEIYDMDELTGSLETQSRYTSVNNPLLKEAAAVQ
ncbi:hypothetical protein PO124_10870 [Bacillus licheniformis]|nr:hypothetical protein [Bacillus licheniformis]